MEVFLKPLQDFGHFAILISIAISTIFGAVVSIASVVSSSINKIRQYWWEVKSWQPPKGKFSKKK